MFPFSLLPCRNEKFEVEAKLRRANHSVDPREDFTTPGQQCGLLITLSASRLSKNFKLQILKCCLLVERFLDPAFEF